MKHPFHHPRHPHYWKYIFAFSFIGVLAASYVLFDYFLIRGVSSETIIEEPALPIFSTAKKLPTKTPTIATMGTCTDSDGENIHSVGKVTLETSSQVTEYADTCKASSYFVVQEQICENGIRKVKEVQCPLGCNYGACGSTGTVFIAHTFDTEASNGNMDVYQQNFSLKDYAPGSMMDRVMNEPTYVRTWYKDSFGQGPKYTWFLLAQNSYCKSVQNDCAMIHEVMKQKYSEQIAKWGDELALHYHTADWSDQNGDGVYYWNQLLSLNGTPNFHGTDIQSAERIWSYLLLEKQFFTSMFRSGWAWEDNDFSNWLDDVAIFDYSNLSPLANTKVLADRNGNIFDWRRAPQSWTPYQPSYTDYQVPGDQKRWQFRIMTSGSIDEYRKAFAQANRGENVLVETVAHSYNGGYLLESDSILKQLAREFPNVKYRFTTTLEGTQRVLGLDDRTAPEVTHTRVGSSVKVTSSEKLFAFPYFAVKTPEGAFFRVRPVNPGASMEENRFSWTFDLSAYPAGTTYAVGGSDLAGNSFVTEKATL